MAATHTLFTFLLILLLLLFTASLASGEPRREDLKEACSATRHPALCIRSLSPFSNSASGNPAGWARAAVSVSLSEAERVAHYLSFHVPRTMGKDKLDFALLDCVECVKTAVDQLHSALEELRRFGHGEFGLQISNVDTWVSAALTGQETCLEGLKEFKQAAAAAAVRSRVVNASYFASNALAIVNKLAASGGRE